MEFKAFYSDLPKNVGSNLKNKTNCIILNFLVEHTIKNFN